MASQRLLTGTCLGLCWLLGALAAADAATPTPEVQRAVRAATYEVVLHKADTDPLSYEKPLPLELEPYITRSDHYWSIGTAFAIGPNTFVSAAHVLAVTVDSQYGAPALRDGSGHVYPVHRILKFSAHEDFVVFDLTGAPTAAPLPTSTEYKLDDVVFAVGNALGEGVVIRDGLLTSETPEDQDGRWKWLRFSAAASPGNSGGPLLDAGGQVLGIVAMKSPNENLNYALPIARVLNGSEREAQFDLRHTARLPYARSTQVATLNTQFGLPKEFSEFERSYQSVMLDSARSDQEKLRAALAGELFPKGNSGKLLATVYDSPLPAFVQQNSTDTWDAIAADKVTDQDLPGKGLVSSGTTLNVHVFRLRRPDGASDGAFYQDPRAFMDLLLKGLKIDRQVGDQTIRITSLGRPRQSSVWTDGFGRRWQISSWPLGYTDYYLICFALPVPEGYVGIAESVPSFELGVANEYIKLLANNAYVSYAGTMAQWKSFLDRRELRPSIFDRIKIELDAHDAVLYESPRLTLRLPKDLLDTTSDSELALRMTYMLDGKSLVWDVGGLYLYKDRNHHTYIGVERHVKPTDESATQLLETWNHMSLHGAGFNGVAGHDDEFRNYWIHNAVSAASPKNPGIDPSAQVLYDVYYRTDAASYPINIEDSERRLVEATRVLER